MKIYVLTTEPFPNGGAATNRMLSYLSRLAVMGYSINMVSFSNNSGFDQKCLFQHSHFENIQYSCIRIQCDHKVLKRLCRVFSYIVLAMYSLITSTRLKPSVVLSVTNSTPIQLFGYFIAKTSNAKYLLEKSEYPFVLLRSTNHVQMKLGLLKIRLIYKLFDGLLVMTGTLMDFLRGVCRKSASFHHMPMTVDFDRFKLIASEKENWITYIGSFGKEKDGVQGLIESFRMVIAEHSDWSLVLIGAVTKAEGMYLSKLVEKYGLTDRVIFTGMISYAEVPKYLAKSRILALARPSSLQAHYGFPSKLGEYLASGNPVVVTNVGEIKLYLQDGVSAMIAQPGNPFEFGLKINYLIENPDVAERIGAEGKKVAVSSFDADNNTLLFSKYLRDLVKEI